MVSFREVKLKILLLVSCPVMSDPLWPHGLQHARLPCPSSSPGLNSKSCPLSQWCHPTILSSVSPFSWPQSFPLSGSFPMNQLFALCGQSIGDSALAFSPSNEYSRLVSFNIDWSDLPVVQGTHKSLLQHHNVKALILQCLYGPTFTSIHDYWENHSFDYIGLCQQRSLPFNTLSRFVIAVLPRNKCLLISWLQSLSTVILELKKLKSVIVYIFFLIYWLWSDGTRCHDLNFFFFLPFLFLFFLI